MYGVGLAGLTSSTLPASSMSTPPHPAVASLAALLQRVEDLPKKVRHGGCMVPLTPVAFQPGELFHTNDFFVT